MPRTSHIDSANLDFRGDFSSATAAWRGHGKRVISVTCAKKFEDNRTILTDRSPVMYIDSRILYKGGGLKREGAYFKVWLRGEGLIREGGLIERGAYFKFWLRGEGLIREGAY